MSLPVRLCLILFPLCYGLIALALGQDANWDLRNYHWYNPYAFLNGKIGFAYQDGKDDAKVPQDDDYFGAAVALSAVARVRNATGNTSVTLPKDAYLTVAASAAVAEAATVEVIVFGIAEGVQ